MPVGSQLVCRLDRERKEYEDDIAVDIAKDRGDGPPAVELHAVVAGTEAGSLAIVRNPRDRLLRPFGSDLDWLAREHAIDARLYRLGDVRLHEQDQL